MDTNAKTMPAAGGDMYARLDRITEKLDAEITARGLDESNNPLSDGTLTAFSLLAAAIGIAARGASRFTDEEAVAFERIAGKILSMADPEP